MMKRILAALLGVAMPPIGVFTIRGMGLGTYINAALFVIALGVFFLVAALPGLGLWLLSIAYALVVCLFLPVTRT